MWDDLQQFIDSLIAKYGVFRVLLAPFGVIGLFAGVGLITTGTASLVAVFLGLFMAVVVIGALSLQLRTTRRLLAERTRIVNLYTGRFARSIESYAYVIEDWDESVTVSKNGDTTLEKWVTIQVGDEDLYSVWSWIYKRNPVGNAERNRVKVEARSFDENRELGARYDVTSAWEGNRVQLFVHFEQPAHAGQIVRIWLRWEWPEYYNGLLAGEIDVVEWLMHRPTKRIATKMLFDTSCKIRSAFHVTPHADCPVPQQTINPDKSLIVAIEYSDVPVDTRIGFRLDGSTVRR